ncbi:hypothetical protein EJA72_25500 [Pseudomonas sp. PB120]|nr:hypothetical protein [Pseudomonas sp. PB120]
MFYSKQPLGDAASDSRGLKRRPRAPLQFSELSAEISGDGHLRHGRGHERFLPGWHHGCR